MTPVGRKKKVWVGWDTTGDSLDEIMRDLLDAQGFAINNHQGEKKIRITVEEL